MSVERQNEGTRAPAERFARAVLLTGATGYLGAHLLADLLAHSDARITCLVRGADDESARASLRRQWDWYFPGAALDEARVQVVRGDLEAPGLGLSSVLSDALAQSHDLIVNAAADVSHVGAASRSFRVNTEAVAALIELAQRGKTKALHHVSTISVRGDMKGGTPLTAFRESHLEEGQSFYNAYGESKFRAEVLIRKAFAAGLPGAVYRVGYVGPHSVTGRYQRNIHQSATARYVRAAVTLGFAPFPGDETVQITPVDVVARGIALLLMRAPGTGQTYYVESPQLLRKYDVMRVLHAAGYTVRLIDEAEFVEKAPSLSQDADALSVITPPPLDQEPLHLPLDSTWSQRELRKLGFQFSRLNSAWFGRFLGHAIEEGFLEAPRFWSIAPPLDGLF